MLNRIENGCDAETRALEWLGSKYADAGFVALVRNYRRKCGEIDFIFEIGALGERELVFVEVRARAESGWVTGIESVTFRKQRRISRTVAVFLAAYDGRARSARVDIMDWDGKIWRHFENVWIA